MATTPAAASTASTSAPAAPSFFTFKDYLSAEEQETFFDWDHSAQVDKVAAYLAFVAAQPAAAQFTSSKRASVSWAERCDSRGKADIGKDDAMTLLCVLEELLEGRAKSGFGAFGSEDGFLPQKELSLAVARSVEAIGHEYLVERTKSGEIRPRVLNSRSFYLNWCHAEKQKLMDIRLKLDRLGVDPVERRVYWDALVVIVDRVMCPDCIQYARCLAVDERAHIAVRDPTMLRTFPPSKNEPIVAIELSNENTLE